MPWKIVGNKVIRSDTGKVVGRSKNPKKYLRALYANVKHKAVQMRTQGRGRFMPIMKKMRKYRMMKPIAMMHKTDKAFDPRQPRYPRGHPFGGQWKGAVSGEILTGGRQKAARMVARLAEKQHGSLPTYRIRVTRGKLGGRDTADYTAGQIRLSARSQTPHLDTAHEIGHLIDHRRYGFGSVNGKQFEGWRRAVDRSETTKRWKAWNALGHIAVKGNRYFVDRSAFRYALDRREQFARSYAQYLSRKSRHGGLRRNLRLARKPITTYYWSDREFRPIERELDRLFYG